MPGRIPRTVSACVFAILAAALSLAPAQTPCPAGWTGGIAGYDATDGTIADIEVFDDGSGPALYAIGNFRAAGDVPAAYVARWTGVFWEPVGNGPPGGITYPTSLAVYDDGTGPALHVADTSGNIGGTFVERIHRWDGAAWTTLPAALSGNPGQSGILGMTVFDSGFGPELIAGGSFLAAGGSPANHVAAWNGTSWRPLGAGLGTSAQDVVWALTVFDDGNGPALLAGGYFAWTAGATPSGAVARWNGTAWSPVGALSGYSVSALEVYDDGGGPKLYAGGNFPALGSLARWDGSAWTAVGGGLGGSPPFVRALCVFDDGSGPGLYAGGGFSSAGAVATANIARYDANGWSAAGAGLTVPGASATVSALAAFDDGTGAFLWAGGNFRRAGAVDAGGIARWDGSLWSNLRLAPALLTRINDLAVFDAGAGPALYAAGVSNLNNLVTGAAVARWTAPGWTPVGAAAPLSFDAVSKLHVHDDGAGAALYAAGSFTSIGSVPATNIARFDGAAWSPLGGGIPGTIRALASFDAGAGPELWAAGSFSFPLPGGGQAVNVARWNGSAWAAAGTFIGNTTGVASLAVFDDGTGPALYAGRAWGSGGAPAGGLWRWSGTGWTTVWNPGSTVSQRVTELAVYDDGSGPALFGAAALPGYPSNALVAARWTGTGWLPLGAFSACGGYAEIDVLRGFDDGSGPALFAGGEFYSVNAVLPIAYCARASPATGWTAPGGGLDARVRAAAVFDAGTGPSLFLGGDFSAAGGLVSRALAAWGPDVPRIIVHPRAPPAHAGAPLALRCLATGAAPLAFTWRKDGTPLPGATGSTLTIPAPSTADSGLYDVVVANACGTAVSIPTTLDVRLAGLRVAQDHGPRSARVRVAAPPGSPLAFTALSFDPANSSAPGQGGLAGLHIPFPDLLSQVAIGVPPFLMPLDAAGGADWLLPAAALPAPLLGRTLWSVSVILQPAPLAVLGASPVASLTLR